MNPALVLVKPKFSLARNDGGRRSFAIQGHPVVRDETRLTLDVTVGRLAPKLHLIVHVVEDEVSAIRVNRQHGMAGAAKFRHHGDQ